MESVGMNGVQQVRFNTPAVATQPSFEGKAPEMKEDGDKKLMGALAGLAAITIAGVGLYKGRHKIGQIFKKTGQEIPQKTSKLSTDDFKKANIAFDSNGKMITKDGKITFADGKPVGTKKSPFEVRSANGESYIKYVDGLKIESSDGKIVKKFTTNKKGEKITSIYTIMEDGSQQLEKTQVRTTDGKIMIYDGEAKSANLAKRITSSGDINSKSGKTTTIETNFSGKGKKQVANTTEKYTDTAGKSTKNGQKVERHIETVEKKENNTVTTESNKSFFKKTKK